MVFIKGAGSPSGEQACHHDPWKLQQLGRVVTRIFGSYGPWTRWACHLLTTHPYPRWQWCPEVICNPEDQPTTANRCELNFKFDSPTQHSPDIFPTANNGVLIATIAIALYLQDLLHTTGNLVMLLPNNVGVHDTWSGVERVHGRVDTQLCDATGQHSGGVQVSKSCSRGRIRQVISRHIDSLGVQHQRGKIVFTGKKQSRWTASAWHGKTLGQKSTRIMNCHRKNDRRHFEHQPFIRVNVFHRTHHFTGMHQVFRSTYSPTGNTETFFAGLLH